MFLYTQRYNHLTATFFSVGTITDASHGRIRGAMYWDTYMYTLKADVSDNYNNIYVSHL